MGTVPEPFLWIQTRDGSPTLWNNLLGESFRSVRGAFTESRKVFVDPGMAVVKQRDISPENPIVIIEFGLGPGTNWFLWNLAAREQGLPFEYYAIEKDLSSFELGKRKWREVLEGTGTSFEDLKMPTVFSCLEEALSKAPYADLWFHDPFGFEVNPDGYSPSTLLECSRLWKLGCRGFSYACNRHFRESLEKIPGVQVLAVPTQTLTLKRERLEFSYSP